MKTSINTTKTVATHNGIFHADEVTAVALLKVFTTANYVVTRTRDEAIITASDIAVDVGGVYDIDASRFDHHQSEYVGTLSSAGMVWAEVASPRVSINQLIAEVDAQDIGVKRNPAHHYCQIISSFNTTDIYSEAQDQAFEHAVEFAVRYLTALNQKDIKAAQDAHEVTNTELITIKGVRFAMRHKEDSFIPASMFKGVADVVISWDSKQSHWTVSSIDSKEFTLSPTGRESETFCHKAGFIGGYKEENYLPCSDPFYTDGVVVVINSKQIIIPMGNEYLA